MSVTVAREVSHLQLKRSVISIINVQHYYFMTIITTHLFLKNSVFKRMWWFFFWNVSIVKLCDKWNKWIGWIDFLYLIWFSHYLPPSTSTKLHINLVKRCVKIPFLTRSNLMALFLKTWCKITLPLRNHYKRMDKFVFHTDSSQSLITELMKRNSNKTVSAQKLVNYLVKSG